jgi:hypothetical protein
MAVNWPFDPVKRPGLDAEVVAQVLPDAADSAVSNNQQSFQKIAKPEVWWRS